MDAYKLSFPLSLRVISAGFWWYKVEDVVADPSLNLKQAAYAITIYRYNSDPKLRNRIELGLAPT